MGGVAGSGGGEGCHGASLVDSGVQDLSVGRFLVAKKQVTVHRHVLLAIRVVDLRGGEEGVHTKGARLIGNDHLDALTGAIGL